MIDDAQDFPEEYWVLDLSDGLRFAVVNEQLPHELAPPPGALPLRSNGWRPDESTKMVWVKDISGGPIGFPLSAVRSVIWSTPAIREADAAWQKVCAERDDPKPWE